jgi:uncharacterized protein YecE (DUF72 family)
MEKWPLIVGDSYDDAIQHVRYNLGYSQEYKEKELIDWREQLKKENPDEVFAIINEMLQKAFADSVLDTH